MIQLWRGSGGALISDETPPVLCGCEYDPCIPAYPECSGLARGEWTFSAENRTPSENIPPVDDGVFVGPLDAWSDLGRQRVGDLWAWRIRFDFEDSLNSQDPDPVNPNPAMFPGTCGQALNPYRQRGQAEKPFYCCGGDVTIHAVGMIEGQDAGLELLQAQIFNCDGGDPLLAYSDLSIDANTGCTMILHDSTGAPNTSITLAAGWYFVRVTVDSVDELYHNSAYWRFTLTGPIRE